MGEPFVTPRYARCNLRAEPRKNREVLKIAEHDHDNSHGQINVGTTSSQAPALEVIELIKKSGQAHPLVCLRNDHLLLICSSLLATVRDTVDALKCASIEKSRKRCSSPQFTSNRPVVGLLRQHVEHPYLDGVGATWLVAMVSSPELARASG